MAAAPRKRPAGGRSARSTASRKTASTRGAGSSRRQKTQDDEEAAEEGGIGWEGGVGIVTFLILLAAILILDHDLGTKYPEEGIFFDVPADGGTSTASTSTTDE